MGPGGRMPVRKAKNVKGTLMRIWRYLYAYKVTLIVIVVLGYRSFFDVGGSAKAPAGWQ